MPAGGDGNGPACPEIAAPQRVQPPPAGGETAAV